MITVELGPSHTIFHRDIISLPRSSLNGSDIEGCDKLHELICKFLKGRRSVPGKARSIIKLVAFLNPAAVLLGDWPVEIRFNRFAISRSIDVILAPVSKCARICSEIMECDLPQRLKIEAVETITLILSPLSNNGTWDMSRENFVPSCKGGSILIPKLCNLYEPMISGWGVS